jgi:hypothetical protein
MKLRKAPTDNLTLQRPDRSLDEDLLTEAYSFEEIVEQLRALGGVPKRSVSAARLYYSERIARQR